LLTQAAKARLSRLGLQPGYPDLLIQWHPSKVLWIELKTHLGRVSDIQKERHALLQALGFPVVICRCVEDVLDALRLHGVPMNKVMI
jgi:hypothetical protein